MIKLCPDCGERFDPRPKNYIGRPRDYCPDCALERHRTRSRDYAREARQVGREVGELVWRVVA